MESNNAMWVIGIPLAPTVVGLIPDSWANRHVPWMKRLAVSSTLIALFFAAFATLHVGSESVVRSVGVKTFVPGVTLSVYFDALAAVMALLISFIGCVIAHFSLRYLDGEPTQGRFLRWLAFTLGAVLWLVVSGNLLLFTATWIATSFGLHQLLTHYRDRPAALWAARKKFVISRLGDLMLIAALILTYREFHGFEYDQVFAGAREMASAGGGDRWSVALLGFFFVVGAMTKSAQFPMHSWLPDTMETPTPVSALMHAGIINAGGFLVLRLSPVVSLSHLALDFLAIVGAITALFGATVMLTQTSIKRALAYSTIAQMGFMMLQCGLGSFAAALLHIVAHALYKAHAFLTSGSVLEMAARTRGIGKTAKPEDADSKADERPKEAPPGHVVALMAAALVAGLILAAVPAAWGVSLWQKPGGIVLGAVLGLALLQLLWRSFLAPRVSWLWGLLTAAGVAVAYFGAYRGFELLVADSMAREIVATTPFDVALGVATVLGFVAVFLLQAAEPTARRWAWFRGLYVHLSNGLYIDVAAQRVVAWLWAAAPSRAR